MTKTIQELEKEIIWQEARYQNIWQLAMDSSLGDLESYCIEPGIKDLEEAEKILRERGDI